MERYGKIMKFKNPLATLPPRRGGGKRNAKFGNVGKIKPHTNSRIKRRSKIRKIINTMNGKLLL